MSRADANFDLIHINVGGPYRSPTHNRCRFFLIIIDDYSKMTWLYLLKLTSDVFLVLKSFFHLVRTQFNKHIKRVRSDNEPEFFNNECNTLLNSFGIIRESRCPYTPQQNRIVERKHKHILEVVRSLKFQGNISIRF